MRTPVFDLMAITKSAPLNGLSTGDYAFENRVHHGFSCRVTAMSYPRTTRPREIHFYSLPTYQQLKQELVNTAAFWSYRP
jgi:hypothetical protein